MTVKRKAVPDIQILVWHSQLGCGVLLLNINSFTEHQHQTRPLCDHDGSRQNEAKRCKSFLTPPCQEAHIPYGVCSPLLQEAINSNLLHCTWIPSRLWVELADNCDQR